MRCLTLGSLLLYSALFQKYNPVAHENFYHAPHPGVINTSAPSAPVTMPTQPRPLLPHVTQPSISPSSLYLSLRPHKPDEWCSGPAWQTMCPACHGTVNGHQRPVVSEGSLCGSLGFDIPGDRSVWGLCEPPWSGELAPFTDPPWQAVARGLGVVFKGFVWSVRAIDL